MQPHQQPITERHRRIEAEAVKMLGIIRGCLLRDLIRGTLPLTPAIARELAALSRDVGEALARLAGPLPPLSAPEPSPAAH